MIMQFCFNIDKWDEGDVCNGCTIREALAAATFRNTDKVYAKNITSEVHNKPRAVLYNPVGILIQVCATWVALQLYEGNECFIFLGHATILPKNE